MAFTDSKLITLFAGIDTQRVTGRISRIRMTSGQECSRAAQHWPDALDRGPPRPLWGQGTPYPTEVTYLGSSQYLTDLDFVKRHGCNDCGQTQDELDLTAFWADTNGNA